MDNRGPKKRAWSQKVIGYLGTAAMLVFILASVGLVGIMPEVATHPTGHTERLTVVLLTSIIGASLGLAIGCAFLTDDEEQEGDD